MTCEHYMPSYICKVLRNLWQAGRNLLRNVLRNLLWNLLRNLLRNLLQSLLRSARKSILWVNLKLRCWGKTSILTLGHICFKT